MSEISQGSGQRVEGGCVDEEQLPGAAQLAATRTKKDRRIFLSDDELLGGERADPRARRDGAACAQSACSACRAGCSRRCATRSTRCRSSRAAAHGRAALSARYIRPARYWNILSAPGYYEYQPDNVIFGEYSIYLPFSHNSH